MQKYLNAYFISINRNTEMLNNVYSPRIRHDNPKLTPVRTKTQTLGTNTQPSFINK